jgi:hypothetical protein
LQLEGFFRSNQTMVFMSDAWDNRDKHTFSASADYDSDGLTDKIMSELIILLGALDVGINLEYLSPEDGSVLFENHLKA